MLFCVDGVGVFEVEGAEVVEEDEVVDEAGAEELAELAELWLTATETDWTCLGNKFLYKITAGKLKKAHSRGRLNE